MSLYLWFSWTPFAGWFWHPTGSRPPLTSSTAESLVLLTADPPWVWAAHSQICPVLTLPLTAALWPTRSRSNPWSLEAHSTGVLTNNTWEDEWINGWVILSRVGFRSDLTSSGVHLSSLCKGQASHGPMLLFSGVYLLLWSNSTLGGVITESWMNQVLVFRVGQQWTLVETLQKQSGSPSQCLGVHSARQDCTEC